MILRRAGRATPADVNAPDASEAPIRPRRLVLHTSLDEAGTRTVNRALSKLRPDMRDQGVGVITHQALLRLPASSGWSGLAPRPVGPSRTRFSRDVASLVRESATWLETSRPVIFISTPSALGHDSLAAVHNADPIAAGAAARDLISAVAPEETTIVLDVMRQDRLYRADYAAYVADGGTDAPEDVLPLADAHSRDYEWLVAALGSLPGVTGVFVRPAEYLQAGRYRFVGDLLDTADLQIPDRLPGVIKRSKPLGVTRPMWSDRALLLAKAVNPFLETRSERRRFHQFATALLPGPKSGANVLGSRSLIDAILEPHQAANRELFESHGNQVDANVYHSEASMAPALDHLKARIVPPDSEQPIPVAADPTKSSPPRLIVHAGLQKTGTTLLQKALRELRPELHASGIAYVDRRDIQALPARRGWGAYTESGEASYRDFSAQLKALAAAELAAAQKSFGAPPTALLLSNESAVGAHARGPTFERPFRPRAEVAISQLIETLKPYATDVVLYVRRQDQYIESQYMFQIHGGEYFDFEWFYANSKASPVLMYTRLADRIRAIPGVASVTIRPFELIRNGAVDYLQTLLDVIDIDDLDLSIVDEFPRVNTSYGQRALELAMHINPLLETKDERRRWRHLMGRLVEDDAPAQLLSDKQRLEVINTYRADNERLFAAYMPEYPVDTYSTLDGINKLYGALGAA